MKAYSQALREQAMTSVDSGECTLAHTAEHFRMSESSLERCLKRTPLPSGPSPTTLAGAVGQWASVLGYVAHFLAPTLRSGDMVLKNLVTLLDCYGASGFR